jgi:NO-binding membrane sensor protein with MHYT domain/two-component sensor histidine kinase
VIVGYYNAWVVVLSVVVAIVASYVALDLTSRVTASRDERKAWLWLGGGAFSMGSGIWSMHFIGMLALTLPVEVTYDVWMTLLSLLLPILVSGFALYSVSRRTVSAWRLLLGGVALGIGIVAMHYCGMAAMRMVHHYRVPLVSLSILIAIAASLGALWSAFQLRMETILSALWTKAGSAVLAGSGIAAMHYIGMAATMFEPGHPTGSAVHTIDNVVLAVVVSVFSLLLLAVTLLISAFDAWLAAHAMMYAAQLEARVAERTTELERTNRELVEVEDTQRRRLSRKLHDRIGQNLTALRINLGILMSQFAGESRTVPEPRLRDCIDLVDATADAVQDLVSELRPPMLEEHGLLAALRWHAQQFARRTDIEVTISGDEPGLTPNEKITLFRIVQEALNNVAKHSRATRVELGLRQVGTELGLSVLDNGIGIDASRGPVRDARLGYGIDMMYERARAIGGQLEIDVAPGGGTHVRVRVPNLSS